MRRLAFISLTISGSVLLLFMVNLLLFNYVPSYHDALEAAVAGDSEIPMVVIDENKEAVVIRRDAMTIGNDKASKALNILETTELEAEENVPLSGTVDDAQTQSSFEKRIVDKKYYEDCGSDKGYWVITYEDGTTSIEK